MDQLKLTVRYVGSECEISVAHDFGFAVGSEMPSPKPVLSPSDFVGCGGCFGDALHDFRFKLNAYIDALVKFRDDVVQTERAYSEAVQVDCNGRVL